MSAQSQPISAARFAAALPDLPLSSLHAKAAEIQNSVAHLHHSNTQLQKYADEGDKDCEEAINENIVVLERQLERIQLIKAEVEQRGFKWDETSVVNGTSDTDMIPHIVSDDTSHTNGNDRSSNAPGASRQGGTLTDEELAQRLAQQLAEDENGVHL